MAEFDDIYYIHQVKSGKTNAFLHIVRRYRRMIFTIVNKIIPNEEEAEDLVQEIFIKVFQKLDKFKEQSEFATWIYRIAYNTTISQTRKRKYEFSSIEGVFENFPEQEIDDSINYIEREKRLNYLDIVLKKLSAEDTLMITMFYLEDFSIRGISEVTGHNENNVKVKLHRIRKFMNFEINKLMKDETAE